MRWSEEQFAEYEARRQRGAGPVAPSMPEKKIIKQSRRALNKTEQRFETQYLKPWLAMGEIDEIGDHESITLRLANGLRLRPDFPTWKDGKLTFYEVKGERVWEDAIKSLKIAANKFPRFRFIICKYVKGEWFKQEVLP